MGYVRQAGSIPPTPTRLNFFQNQRRFVARSPRRSLSAGLKDRVALRKKSLYSAINWEQSLCLLIKVMI